MAMLAGSALGCGPVEYLSQVSGRAATAVADAKREGAAEWAPFEYVAANEYLHEAREAGGHAHYQDAIEYGHQAEVLATRARVLTSERRRSTLKPNEFDDPENKGKEQVSAPPADSSEPATPSEPAASGAKP